MRLLHVFQPRCFGWKRNNALFTLKSAFCENFWKCLTFHVVCVHMICNFLKRVWGGFTICAEELVSHPEYCQVVKFLEKNKQTNLATLFSMCARWTGNFEGSFERRMHLLTWIWKAWRPWSTWMENNVYFLFWFLDWKIQFSYMLTAKTSISWEVFVHMFSLNVVQHIAPPLVLVVTLGASPLLSNHEGLG